MKVFLTGGSGKLGKEVLRLIPGAVPLVRRPSGLKNEKIVDFEGKELRKALSGCDILVHLAGSLKFHNPKELRKANVTLTKNLLDSLPKKAKVVFASSVSVYGKNVSGIVGEKTPPNPDSPYAKTKYEAERMVMSRPGSVALRIGPIYGPGYEDYPRFLNLIKKGRMVVFGSGKNLVSFVHVSDVAKAVKKAMSAKPGIYVVSGESISQEEIYGFAAKLIGASPPKRRVPLPLALAFAKVEEMRASLSGKKPLIAREHVSILGKSRRFDCSKAKKELGFRPRPLKKGIREMAKTAGF